MYFVNVRNNRLILDSAYAMVQVTSLLTVLNRYFQFHYVPPSAPAAERKRKLFNLVRKRDRPSILAWLANASVKQRRLCGRMMQRMQVAQEDAPVTAGAQAFRTGSMVMDAIIHQVKAPLLVGPLHRSMAASGIVRQHLS